MTTSTLADQDIDPTTLTDAELATALAEAETQGRYWLGRRHYLRLEDQRRRGLLASRSGVEHGPSAFCGCNP